MPLDAMPFDMILMMGALFVLMYFFLMRPANKRMREQMENQRRIAEGERVQLTSGIIGTVKHLGDKQAVVEIAPDVDITVMRAALSRTVPASEEEFEFVDEEPTCVTPDADARQPDPVSQDDDFPLYDPSVWSREHVANEALTQPEPSQTEAPQPRPDLDENKDK